MPPPLPALRVAGNATAQLLQHTLYRQFLRHGRYPSLLFAPSGRAPSAETAYARTASPSPLIANERGVVRVKFRFSPFVTHDEHFTAQSLGGGSAYSGGKRGGRAENATQGGGGSWQTAVKGCALNNPLNASLADICKMKPLHTGQNR